MRPSTWAKSQDRVRRIKATLGELPVIDLDYRVVAEWQAVLGRELAPRTVRHHRQTLAQVVDEAVKLGALVGNPVRAAKPLRVTESAAWRSTWTRRRRVAAGAIAIPVNTAAATNTETI